MHTIESLVKRIESKSKVFYIIELVLIRVEIDWPH